LKTTKNLLSGKFGYDPISKLTILTYLDTNSKFETTKVFSDAGCTCISFYGPKTAGAVLSGKNLLKK
jgi:hypothetical protein